MPARLFSDRSSSCVLQISLANVVVTTDPTLTLSRKRRVGCWRDPLPFVAATARALVSKLAVLFNTLVEDVRVMAENAGLEWHWRKVDGVTVDEGAWEGDCDKVR